jgi:hypothetical protein
MMNAWPYREVTLDELVVLLHEEIHDTMTHYGGSLVKAGRLQARHGPHAKHGFWRYEGDEGSLLSLLLQVDFSTGALRVEVYQGHGGERFDTLDALLRYESVHVEDPMISAAIEIWDHLKGNTYKVSSSGQAPSLLPLDVETFWEQEVRTKFEALPQSSRLKLWRMKDNHFKIEHAWIPVKRSTTFYIPESPQPYVSVARARGAVSYPITTSEKQELPGANWDTIENDLREVTEAVHPWCF